MTGIVQSFRKKRRSGTAKVAVWVNPYLSNRKKGFRCDDVRSRIMRVSGRSRLATRGVYDEDLQSKDGVLIDCKSAEHAVDLVNSILTSIPEGEVRAVLKGKEVEPWPQEVKPVDNVRPLKRR